MELFNSRVVEYPAISGPEGVIYRKTQNIYDKKGKKYLTYQECSGKISKVDKNWVLYRSCNLPKYKYFI